jgi:hypothetical protein
MIGIELAGEAWLHRNGKATWRFIPNPIYGELVHITRSGNVYAILAGHKVGKPFWIGILQDRSWLTCENILRARSIEFADAGEYVFPVPKAVKRNQKKKRNRVIESLRL